MKKHKNGFTLAEVLITLVIIGIIAAMTIPSVIQNTKKQELSVKLKKNYSTILNALKLAQVHEGMIDDNRAVFMPSESDTRHYDTAKRFSKYLNTSKICKHKSDFGCSDVYYDITYATEKEDVWNSNFPAIVLTDGSIYKILQFIDCEEEQNDYVVDDEGNEQVNTWTRLFCAQLYVDVNGAKKPNKFGEDVFALNIYQNKVLFNMGTLYGGKTATYEILTNSK